MHHNGDGSWTTVMNHFQSFPTRTAAVEAAVAALHGWNLRTDWDR
jgi:hypothetical protein